MLQPETFSFLKNLAKKNNREWFEANRTSYQNARGDFENFISSVMEGVANFDDDIAELTARESIFRQNRDVRFSKDKSPYKIHMGAYFNRGSKKINTPGYYIHLQPGKSMLAGGLYQPEPSMLAKVRQEIDYNADEWTAIMSDKKLRKCFMHVPQTTDSLKRVPKGYDEDNRMIEFLKLKSFVVSTEVTDDYFLDKTAVKATVSAFKSLYPLIAFLNRAIE